MRWAMGSVPSIAGYSHSCVVHRFIQRCVELTMPAYMQICIEMHEHDGRLPDEAASLNCGGMHLRGNGSVGLTLSVFIRNFIVFLLVWMRALRAALIGTLSSYRNSTPYQVALVYGVGADSLFVKGSDHCFLEYCHSGRISPLAEAEYLVVQTARPVVSSQPGHVCYVQDPLEAVVRMNGFSLEICWQFILLHCRVLFDFFRSLWRNPALCLLGRDLAQHALAWALNQSGSISHVIQTNSNYLSQPLWMRNRPDKKFSTHMVWYSQNSAPIVSTHDPIAAPLPNFRHIDVDHMWVWTEGFREFLLGLGCKAEFHVIGPIVWQIPERAPRKYDHIIRIAVFDVSPLPISAGKKIGLIWNYYCSETAMKFIGDIVAAKKELEAPGLLKIKIMLKHKRNHTDVHDAKYINYVDSLSCNGDIDKVSFDTNIYSLIDSCDFVIVMPYSSPAYIASELGKQSIYYDPTGEVIPTFERQPCLRFVSGRAQFAMVLRELCEQ